MHHIFQRSSVKFYHPILYGLESTCGKQCHAISKELLSLHAFYHNTKGRYERLEVTIDSPYFFYKKLNVLGFVFYNLLLFVKDEFKVQLCNLVVHDENFLI